MDKASEFREEAAALREAASLTQNRSTRETLLKMAEEYDRMAAYPVANEKKLPPILIR